MHRQRGRWILTVLVCAVYLAATVCSGSDADEASWAKTHEFQRARRASFLDSVKSVKNRRAAVNYVCDGCLANYTEGAPAKLRVMFIEGKDVAENNAASEAAVAAGHGYSCGSCCFDAALARPECFVAENWNTGWIAKPLLKIMQLSGADIVALTPANTSKEATEVSGETNPYGTCPYEILLGNVDLCIGDFWETIDRRQFVAFTTPLDVNHFKLITIAEQSNEFGAGSLLKIFEPFTPGVWATMIGMFAFASLCMWIVSGENEDFPAGEAFPAPSGLVKGFWVSSMGYLAGNQYAADTWAAKLIVLGFSFFLAITVASYTANLASFMVLRPTAIGQISSLEDVVKTGSKLCSVAVTGNMLTTNGIQDRIFTPPSEFMGSLFEGLINGDCKAALVGKMEYMLYVQAESIAYDICTTPGDANYGGGWFCAAPESKLTRFDLTKCQCGTDAPLVGVAPDDCPASCTKPNSKFCSVIEVLDPTLEASFNYAQPVADWVEPFISAGIVDAKMSGQFTKDIKAELYDQNPAACPAGTPQRTSTDNTGSTDAMSLGVDAMAGTYVFSAIAMLLGLLCHTVDLLLQRRRASPQVVPSQTASVDKPNSGETTVVASNPPQSPAEIAVQKPGDSDHGRDGPGQGAGAGVERIEGQLGAMQLAIEAQLVAILGALPPAGEDGSRKWTGRGGSFRKEASFRRGGGGGHGR